MSEQNMWESIPRGKKDPPMLMCDTTKPIPYNFNDPDSQYVMFNRGLEGCVVLPFSKAMELTVGKVTVNGQPVPCTIQPVPLAGYQTYWIGMKVGGYLHEYGKTISVTVSGFRDTDGNEMVPVTIQLESTSKADPDPKYAEHEKIALQAAQDGIILLKNCNHTLPLIQENTLNLFGKGTLEFRLCAVGAGKITPRYAVGFLEAASSEVAVKVNQELIDFYAAGVDELPSKTVLEHAKEQSGTAIMVISRPSGENTDNSTNPGEYYLTKDEDTLIAGLRENFRKLIVILNVGYPISTAFAEIHQVDALLYCGFGGMLAGKAVMDVVMGRVNPSGKLPDTWAESYDSIPASRNFYDCAGGKRRIVSDNSDAWLNTVYEEDIYVGYRYFETFPEAKRGGYPFGYGLSYTTFSLKCDTCIFDESGLEVTAEVCNTGELSGREVVQLYVSKPQGELDQPAREMVGFEKTKLLKPGEKVQLTIHVPLSRMTSYDENKAAYIMVAGEYKLHLGSDVRDTKEIGRFMQSEVKVIKQVKNRMKLNMPLEVMKRGTSKVSLLAGGQSGVVEGATSLQPKRENVEKFEHKRLPLSDVKITFQDVKADPKLLEPFVGSMDVATLARISICACDGWGMEGRGEAGRIFRPEGLELPEFVVADGNSGVNLHEKNIGMPSGATLCASFDRELMEQVGRVIGEEAKELGIDLILAPGMNLHRNPLNGRQPEYFSEDPYLAGNMAGNYCKGLESTGVGGCYKHLIANNAESGRKRNQSIVSERAIRELYFRAFEYAMEEHEPLSVMTAYNAVNGLFASCDPELIQGLLFEECEFKGFVMTDWASYDSADVAEMVMAGNTWITPGSGDDTYTSQIVAAVKTGRLSVEQLQDNVLRMIRVLVQLNK